MMRAMMPSSKSVRGARVRVSVALIALAACAHREPPKLAPVPHQYTTGAGKSPEQIDVRVLVVAFKGARMAGPDQQRTREEARTRATMLADMARGGEKLAELIPTYSDRAGAKENLGGMRLRTSPPDEGRASLVAAALPLGAGNISQPIETDEGFVVLERLKDPAPGPERIGAKHILIAYAGSDKPIVGATRSEAEARDLAEQVLREVRADGANWDEIAAKYTDEPGSKNTGGTLGTFGRGAMVPPFERAAFALKIGQVSEVVKSPFGFHVIKRVE